MPFCPKCRSEYRPGFTTCATCEVPLVEQLIEDDICKSQASMAAHLKGRELEAVVAGPIGTCLDVLEMLQREGMPTMIMEDEGAGQQGMHQLYRLFVAVDDLPRTREIFQRQWRAGLAIEGMPTAAQLDADTPINLEGGPITCPACGHTFTPADEQAECPECGICLGVE